MKISFLKYEEYKDSEVPWLGKIPIGWDVLPIRAFTELKSEKNQPEREVLSVYREFGVIIKSSRTDNHNATSLDTSGYKVVNKYDLVVNKMKAWQGSMGVSEHEGIVSPAYITCKTFVDKINPYFLHYTLRSKTFIGVYNALSYGVRVGQWDMHYDDFKKILLAVPSMEVQEKIVKFLDDKVKKINSLIELKRKAIGLYKEQRHIIIQTAVTKGIDQSVKMSDSKVPWIGKYPEEWNLEKIRNICSFVSRGVTPDYVESSDCMVVNQATFSKGWWDDSKVRFTEYENGSRGLIEAGDVLIASTGGGVLGKTFFVENISGKFQADSHVTILRDKTKRFSPRYLYYFFYVNYHLIDGFLAQGATNQTELQRNWLRDLVIPFPCVEEQESIAEHLEIQESNLNKKIANDETYIKKLIELKKSIVTSAVTGKIKIKD